MHQEHDTIAAPATAAGGAIALIRVSGTDALTICNRIFRGSTPLVESQANRVCYGRIVEGDRIVDDVLVTVFHAPRSYTGEDSVEISCHGSRYIASEILRLLLGAGARLAQPGEFTIRAFLAGKMDLSQAEAVADLIASSSRAAHAVASTQMRGGYSVALSTLRTQLLQLTSLLELELDFSEEDVEFADRAALRQTMQQITSEIETLRHSFSLGNALKQGVAVAIVGAPNVGKSTLLNRLLGEERALVSEIAGTTRDAIEETIDIDGVLFRFIDTAGIRNTDDRLERMGIDRTLAAVERAQIVIHLTDATHLTTTPVPDTHPDTAPAEIPTPGNTDSPPNPENAAGSPKPEDFTFALRPDQKLIEVFNKTDLTSGIRLPDHAIAISARKGTGIDTLRQVLHDTVDTASVYHGDTVVSSTRHYEALTAAHEALIRAISTLDEHHSADFLSEDIREVLHHLGTITGEITNNEILGNIFSKFCIGK